MSGLLGLHRPGSTWLHRLRPGTKLAALAVLGLATALLRGPAPALALLALAGVLVVWSGAGGPTLLRSLRPLLLVVLLLGGWLVWQQGWARAVESVAELVGLVLLATVLTVTTPVDALLQTLTTALGPLRRWGVDPDAVALAFTLVLRAVPSTLEVARETRDAAVARGLQRDPRARLVPLVLRVVARARATGEALQARGIGD